MASLTVEPTADALVRLYRKESVLSYAGLPRCKFCDRRIELAVWARRSARCPGKMLALLASATPSLSLSHAESRVGCEARRSFCAAVSSPSARAFELALLLAAEERPSEDVADISSEVDVIVNALAEKARSRLQLETLVGGDPKDPQCIAAATSRVLFGSEGAGEDDDEAFFSGSSQADYYDPRNSYLDAVLERRQGIPITLSLVYAEVRSTPSSDAPAHLLLAAHSILTTHCLLQVCERLGLQMVGLNAPSHLLIAPADRDVPFVVDPFAGGAILSTDSAAQLVTTNANLGNPDKGRILLKSLRARPMTAQM